MRPFGAPLRPRRLPALAAVLLLSSAVVVTALASPAAAGPSCVDPTAQSEAAAATLAHGCGVRVESLDRRTETTQVFANPDGTRTLETSVRPRFARLADGGWARADATLRENPDGSVSPAASIFPMVLSGGGDGALVTMGGAGRSVSLSWPGRLPAPSLSGSVATYPEVLPGVDLQVRADVDGFSHVLVVKTRQAAANPALARVRYGLTGSGVTLNQDASGAVQARDPSGAALFTSAAPVVWDSTGVSAVDGGAVTGGAVAGAGGGVAAAAARAAIEAVKPVADRRMAPMAARLAGGELELTPPAQFLTDPSVVYPVEIDPSWSGGKVSNAWTSVWSRSDVAGSSFWQNNTALNNASTKGGAGAGRTCDSSDSNGNCTSTQYVIRSMFRMDISGGSGKHILGAKFRIQQQWSWTCSPASNARVWVTGGISSSTTWNNQPSWDGSYIADATANHKYGHTSGCADTGDVEFVVTNLLNHAYASGWGDLTLGLRAISESTTSNWKRFNAGTPVLAIDYNSAPTVGTRSTSPATSCVAGSGTAPAANLPLLSTANPTLLAVTNDPDTENDLQGTFQWQKWNGSAWAAGGSATDPIARANGGTASVTPNLGEGTFRWQVKVGNPWTYGGSSGTDESGWSSWCEFQTDPTPPPVPVPSSAQYPSGCAPCGGVGLTGRFTLSGGAPDVSGYWWGLSDPPSTWVPAASAGASVTFDWTPTSGGPKTLFVQSRDVAGNKSGIGSYPFTVDGPTGPVAAWKLNEGAGTTLVDGTGHGHNATLSGGTLGAPGRIVGGDTALSLAGSVANNGVTSGPVLDTSRSFSVSVWVKLTDRSSQWGLVDQGGTHVAAFAVEYNPTVDKWKLAVTSADSTTPTYTGPVSTSHPVLGSWTNVVAVYDSAAQTARLYVNGVLEATAAGVVMWKANSAMVLGRNGGTNKGSLADVRVWDRVLFDSEVAALVDPLATGKVGLWHFNEVDSSFALDSSDYFHDLTLNGGASIPASGAGHDGTGLLLMDGTGWAQTDGPVLYTDQSFTASAWVRLDDADPGTPAPDLPTGNEAAMGQSGQYMSAFWLGYRYYNGVPTWRFTMRDADADTGAFVDALSAPLTTADVGKWFHLAGVFDANAGTMRLYVNGVLVATSVRTAAWHADGPLTIGGALWTPVGGQPALGDLWRGAIDEARVYAGVVPQPAGDWRFDSCTGTPVQCADAALSAHPVTLSAGASWSPAGESGSGLATNGTNGAAQTAGPVIRTDQSFTVSAWVRLNAVPTGSADAVSQDGTRKSGFRLGYRADSSGWCFTVVLTDTDNGTVVKACSATAVGTGAWVHLAGQYDAVAGTIALFVNGQKVAQTAYTATWNSTGPLAIGRGWNGGGAAEWWNGSVDEVRIYQGVVSDVGALA